VADRQRVGQPNEVGTQSESAPSTGQVLGTPHPRELISDDVIPFAQLSPAQRGTLDPAVEYVPSAGQLTDCRYIHLTLDADAHPVLQQDEDFISRWMGAGGVAFDAGIGSATLACHGGFFLGVTPKRIVGCWHNGFQFLEDGAGELDEGDKARIAFSWSFASISQIFIEGKKKRFSGFEPTQLRLFGSGRGDQLVVVAVMTADAQWLGPRERDMPDPRTQYAALAREIGQAWARYELQREPENRAHVESIAAGSDDRWQAIDSPFEDGEIAIVIQL
jgi:hypothetical protein